MSELTEMFSYTFRSMYKSLVYFIHSLLVTGETPRDPSTVRVLGNPAQASAPEDTSTVPMYFTVKTNKHFIAKLLCASYRPGHCLCAGG